MERRAAPVGARARIVGAQQAAFAQQMTRLLADMARDAVSDLREGAPAAAPAVVAAATPARQDLPPAAGEAQAELAEDAVQAVAIAAVPALLSVPWVAPTVVQAVPSPAVDSPAGVTPTGWSPNADRTAHAPQVGPDAKAAQAAQVSLAPRSAASAVPSAQAAPPGAEATVSVPVGVVSVSALPVATAVVAVAAQPFAAIAMPVLAVSADAPALEVAGGPVDGATAGHAAGASLPGAPVVRGVAVAGLAAVAAPRAQPPSTLSWTGAVPASDTRLLVPLPSTGQESGPAVAAAAGPSSAASVSDADPRMALGWASGLGWLPAAPHHSSAAAAVSAPAAAAAPALLLPAQAGLPGQLQLQINLPDLGPLRLDMQLDAAGQAQLLLQTGSAALAQTLGEHTHQLVDAMRELGLAVQVDVRHDSAGTSGSAGSGGNPSSQQGTGQGGFQSANQGANTHPHRQAQSTADTLAPAASRPVPAHPDNALSYYA